MRKITRDAVQAFQGGYHYRNTNTEVNSFGYHLHGHKIAYKDEQGKIYISICGWNTNTTRERLNGIDGVKVTTKQGQLYLNGNPWNGEYIKI